MAEDVNIGNVGGEGVASEVTLARLVSVTEAMAKKSGIDPKDVTKKLKALSSATEDTIKISSKNRDSLKKNTKEIDKSTDAVSKFGRGLAGALTGAIGSVVGAAVGLTKTLLSGENRLSDFAKHMPLVGEHLGDLVGVLDDSFDTYKQLASGGAAFNNSITDMRIAAAGTHLSLGEFADMVSNNSEKLAAFGGTATQGAVQLSKMHKQMGAQRLELMNAGLTQREVNEALIEYNHLTRAGSRQRRLDDRGLKEQSNAAASYTKHLLTLSKLTGQDVKSLQEKNAAASQSLAFQMKMATMEGEEKKKLMLNLATIQANGGDAAVQAFQAEFLGMPPLTQAAQNYVALNTEGYGLIKASIQDVYDTSLSAKQNEAKQAELGVGLMQTNHDMAVNLGTQVAAMGAGMDGISGLDMETLLGGNIGETIATYTDEAGNFNKAAALANYTAATVETEKKTAVVDSLNSLKIAVGTIQDEMETKVKAPLIEAAGSAVKAITDQITKIPDTELFKTAMTTAKTQIESFGTAMSTLITSLGEPGADPLALTKTAFFDGATAIMNGMKDLMLGKEITSGPQTGQREGGLLESTIIPMVTSAGTAIATGLTELFAENKMVAIAGAVAIAAFFALPSLIAAGTGAIVSSIVGMFGGKAIVKAMKGGIGKLFGLATGAKVAQTAAQTAAATRAAQTAARVRAPAGAVNEAGKKIGGQFLDGPAAKAAAKKTAVRLAAQGLKFIPGVGLVVMGGMAVFDGAGGYNADPNAGFGEKMANAGSSIFNGLTFGLGGSSPEEIAARAKEKADNPDPKTAPPGADLAMVMSDKQLAALERIGKIDLTTFNKGLRQLMSFHMKKLNDFSNLDVASVAAGFHALADIPNLKTTFDTFNSLDATSVINYTAAMEDLVLALNKVNDELAKDNNGLLSRGTGTNAGDMINSVGGLNNGGGGSSEKLNTTMQRVEQLLTEIKDFEKITANNTKNISSSNIANGGVSN